MELELKPARDEDLRFAWSLYGDFVRQNMFSGAPNRRKPSEWNEHVEIARFSEYWAEGGKYLITVDGAPVGWSAIVRSADKITIENWYTLVEWQNKDLASIILSDLVPQWRSEGLQVEAPVLQGASMSAAAERVLTKLGFVEHEAQQHTRVMRTMERI